MSADNYHLIRKDESGNTYSVYRGVMSNDYQRRVDKKFSSLESAIKFAQSEGSEYGIYFDLPVESLESE